MAEGFDQARFSREFGVSASSLVKPSIDLGFVFKDAVALWQSAWPIVCVLSLALVVIPSAGLAFFSDTIDTFLGGTWGDQNLYWIFNLVSYLLLYQLVTMALIFKRENVPFTARAFFELLVPMIILYAVTIAGFALGILLLIVPGIFALVRWYSAVPVLIHKRCSPMQAIARSNEISRGHFWKILLLIAFTIILSSIIEAVVAVLNVNFLSAFMTSNQILFAQSATSLFSDIPATLLSVALYYHLVELNDGKSAAHIEDVFD